MGAVKAEHPVAILPAEELTPGEALPHKGRRNTLDAAHHCRRGLSGRHCQREVNMVGHSAERQNLAALTFGFGENAGIEGLFPVGNNEGHPAISRPDKVQVDFGFAPMHGGCPP